MFGNLFTFFHCRFSSNTSSDPIKMVDYNKSYIRKGVIHYKFIKTKHGLENFTFQDFLNIANKHDEESEDFISAMYLALWDSYHAFKEAFFWECPPIRQDKLNNQFEFVTIEAPSLTSKRQDFSEFKPHFKRNQKRTACSFLNLGGDAMLVTPLPVPGFNFVSLAQFNYEAEESTKGKLWRYVARTLAKELKDGEWKWLSTSGLGVSYLHIRIDRSPKYYQYQPFTSLPDVMMFFEHHAKKFTVGKSRKKDSRKDTMADVFNWKQADDEVDDDWHMQ